MSDREGHYTTNVVVFRTPFLLAEISHEPGSAVINLSHHVEKERFDIVEERFVVQKHFGKQAEVLTIDLVLAPIDLKDRDVIVTIDLVSWWMPHLAFCLVKS